MLSTRLRQVLLATSFFSGIVFLNAALVSEVGAQQGANKPTKTFVHFQRTPQVGVVDYVVTVLPGCELSITDIHINAVDYTIATAVSGQVGVDTGGRPLPNMSQPFSQVYNFTSQSTIIDSRSTGIALLPGDRLYVFARVSSAQFNFNLSGVLACQDT